MNNECYNDNVLSVNPESVKFVFETKILHQIQMVVSFNLTDDLVGIHCQCSIHHSYHLIAHFYNEYTV